MFNYLGRGKKKMKDMVGIFSMAENKKDSRRLKQFINCFTAE